MKNCPYCAEEIQEAAIICRYCGQVLDYDLLPDKYRRCPYCAEWILEEAKACRYCGRYLLKAGPTDVEASVEDERDSLQSEARPEKGGRTSSDRNQGKSKKIRLMLVDDHKGTRDNIRALVESQDDIQVVGEAATGYEGIALYDELLPDVVCTNICMPEMDGITMTKHIREKHKDARILILSVQSEPDYMRRAMYAGALDYLTKPPTKEELFFVIRNLVERY